MSKKTPGGLIGWATCKDHAFALVAPPMIAYRWNEHPGQEREAWKGRAYCPPGLLSKQNKGRIIQSSFRQRWKGARFIQLLGTLYGSS